jgi:hypothetical protein
MVDVDGDSPKITFEIDLHVKQVISSFLLKK